MTMSRILMVILVLAVSACANKDKPLTRIKKTGNGPDEFAILPAKPLQAPQDFASLPTPTPGGSNLTDVSPKADGIAALGGNLNAINTAGIPASDGSLIQHASRFGTTPDIRRTLAAEDAKARRNHGRVNIFNIGPTDNYTDVYKRQWLDSDKENIRLRQAGVTTPSAPPPPN